MNVFAVVAIVGLAAIPAPAQGPAPLGMQRAVARSPRPSSLYAVDAGHRAHWVQGAIIGGLAGLILESVYVEAISGSNRSFPIALVAEATLTGALVGALVGLLFE